MSYPRPTYNAPLVADFVEATAHFTGVSREEIVSRRRFKPITNARKVVYFLARKHGYSYPAIATRVGLTDHCAVIYGRKMAMWMMERDSEFAALVSRVEVKAHIVADLRRARVAASVPAGLRVAA